MEQGEGQSSKDIETNTDTTRRSIPHFFQEEVRARVLSARILVVEDFAPFLQFISTTLTTRHDLQVICEVSDGLEAVRKAEELRPDLILLDIGLPNSQRNRSRPTNPQTCPRIQNHLFDSRVL
jgi:PleD family two-component response regulator